MHAKFRQLSIILINFFVTFWCHIFIVCYVVYYTSCQNIILVTGLYFDMFSTSFLPAWGNRVLLLQSGASPSTKEGHLHDDEFRHFLRISPHGRRHVVSNEKSIVLRQCTNWLMFIWPRERGLVSGIGVGRRLPKFWKDRSRLLEADFCK